MKKIAACISSALMLSACEAPPTAYYNRGDPENLIEVSSEVVNVNLASPDALVQLSTMVSQDPPTRAIVDCSQSDTLCGQAKGVLDKHGIASQWAAGSQTAAKGSVTLVYERVVARDCQNRYIDDTGLSSGNLPPPTFGCSITGNMVQQVSDKRQFTSPSLLDFQDGPKAAQAYEHYLKPTSPAPTDSPMAIYPSAVHPDK